MSDKTTSIRCTRRELNELGAGPRKTVKIRVAVAVDPSGDWYAAGWSMYNGEPNSVEAMDEAIDGVESGEACYWLEAELPIPEFPTVQAKVEVAK